jgi:hypothetical protein
MKNEDLAEEILRELVRNAAETILNDRFAEWHAQYYGYQFQSCYYDDPFEDAVRQLDRLKGCFEEEELNGLFDEAEKSYRSEVDPQVWALFKSKAEPAASDRSDERIPEDISFLV